MFLATLLFAEVKNEDVWISWGINSGNQPYISLSGLQILDYSSGLRFDILRNHGRINYAPELLLGVPILDKDRLMINLLVAPGVLIYKKEHEKYIDFTGSVFMILNHGNLYLTPGIRKNFNDKTLFLQVEIGVSTDILNF